MLYSLKGKAKDKRKTKGLLLLANFAVLRDDEMHARCGAMPPIYIPPSPCHSATSHFRTPDAIPPSPPRISWLAFTILTSLILFDTSWCHCNCFKTHGRSHKKYELSQSGIRKRSNIINIRFNTEWMAFLKMTRYCDAIVCLWCFNEINLFFVKTND